MKKVVLSTLALAAVLMAAPFTQAHADPVPGWYVGAGGIFDDTLTSNAHFGGNQNTVQFDSGWGIEGSGGYAFDSGVRLEGEVSHMRSEVNQVNGGTSGHGNLQNEDMFANILYDFHTGTILTPYIGAGLGLDLINASDIGTFADGGNLNDNQMVFVYQAIAGLAAQLDNHWAVTADYRFIATSDPRFQSSSGNNTTMDNASHNIVVGVRYSFGKPAAPAPAQAAAAPVVRPYVAPKPAVAAVPQSYMVFFDFNKDVLTPEAKRILSAAAQDFRKGGYVRIVVTGHTDTVGTDKYNQKLSERRANAVKSYLETLGVGGDQVASTGVGKSGQLVPTANGVREAQNRRAEIVFDKQ